MRVEEVVVRLPGLPQHRGPEPLVHGGPGVGGVLDLDRSGRERGAVPVADADHARRAVVAQPVVVGRELVDGEVAVTVEDRVDAGRRAVRFERPGDLRGEIKLVLYKPLIYYWNH